MERKLNDREVRFLKDEEVRLEQLANRYQKPNRFSEELEGVREELAKHGSED